MGCLQGDRPVAGDWTGNGQIRIGVFRQGSWYLDLNNNGRWDGVAGGDGFYSFGLPGDIPVVGDWNGDGRAKIGVFRCPTAPATGLCMWVLDTAGKMAFDPATATIAFYGMTGDLPAVSNWDYGSTADRIGIFRNGLWIVDGNGSGAWEPSDYVFFFGLAGDLPVIGDWGSTGTRKIGVFRPKSGMWILDDNGTYSFDSADRFISYGAQGDLPVVGNWSIR